MKKRMGFISNSSSSSFILCGIKIEMQDKKNLKVFFDGNDRKDIQQEVYKATSIGKVKDFDIVYSENESAVYIGNCIFEDEEFYGNSFDLAQLQKEMEDEKVTKLKDTGWDVKLWISQTER